MGADVLNAETPARVAVIEAGGDPRVLNERVREHSRRAEEPRHELAEERPVQRL